MKVTLPKKWFAFVYLSIKIW